MTTGREMTPEEKTYERLLQGIGEMRSEPARDIILEAELQASRVYLSRNYYSYQPFEYDEAMEKVRCAAAELNNRECELLARIWRAALAAAASIDPDDRTHVVYKIYRGYYHDYYRMISGMVEDILQEKKTAERRQEAAKLEPVDDFDVQF